MNSSVLISHSPLISHQCIQTLFPLAGEKCRSFINVAPPHERGTVHSVILNYELWGIQILHDVLSRVSLGSLMKAVLLLSARVWRSSQF